VSRVAELVTSSGALERVKSEAQALVDEAVNELEKVELDGLRPTLISLARAAVDRSS
jgi:geranylgeranyl pyrophosphate synthase